MVAFGAAVARGEPELQHMTTLSSRRYAGLGAASKGQPQVRRCVMQVTWSLVAGGAETYALTVASGLDRGAYRALMCGVDQGGALEPEVERRQIPYHVMFRRPGIDWLLMWRLFLLFRRERVDVIHTHHFNQLFYSLPAAKLLGIRIIHTEHSVEAYKQRRLRWFLKLMSRWCYKVTAIGSDGEQTLRDKVGIAPGRLEVIRAAVDLSRFQADREAARQSLGLTARDRVVVIVARLYPEKNHTLLLQAFARVVKRVPDARLLIVGDGIERDRIEELVGELKLKEAVRLTGVRRDIPAVLAASDVCVLCSEREGLPIAVLEAMAASRPVVATRVGDLPLVVQDQKTGLLVDSHDVTGLADALEDLLVHPDLARQLGEAGRKLVEQQYSLERMVRQHRRLYDAAP